MPRSAKPMIDSPGLVALQADIRPERIELRNEVYTIGRTDACDIVIPKRTVSRVHARVRRHELRCLLEDAQSRNGTYVNGRRISEPTIINPGDRIGIGAPCPHLEYRDPDGTEVSIGALRFDVPLQRFYLDATSLELTPNQFRLLFYLYHNPDVLCTRENCGGAIWGQYNPDLDADNLDRTVSDLRTRLWEAGADSNLIETRRKQGYVLHLETFGETQEDRS